MLATKEVLLLLLLLLAPPPLSPSPCFPHSFPSCPPLPPHMPPLTLSPHAPLPLHPSCPPPHTPLLMPPSLSPPAPPPPCLPPPLPLMSCSDSLTCGFWNGGLQYHSYSIQLEALLKANNIDAKVLTPNPAACCHTSK